MSNNNGDEDGHISVDHSCISCDNCGVGSPQKCCSRCGSFYYCRYVMHHIDPNILNLLLFMGGGII